MACRFCGGGDAWIKTCLAPDGSRLRVCDPCWEAGRDGLLIVPRSHVVTARCDGCGIYGNPRDFAEYRLGGRHGAYSGMCGTCAEEALGDARTELARKGGQT